ncbi:GNAT family N-acetyltransferase [Olleya aquimaris]|uniref:Acetyltransferase (GNAT) family protein n=1 Tax=Olleya aquimaris TaxID=639310 RepID=A0A327RP72_9FLAO|nr:GNAT family N-acetyltransferase [Olleya aquimaris]RAJ17868.1 acetyltransferase (GNAT) family protein [Olleya aquimaris]
MIHFKIYNSVNNLPKSWDSLLTNDVLLKTPFLKALECSCPQNIHTNYVAVYKNEVLVGIAIIQRVEMYIEDVFRKTSDNALKRIGKAIIAKIVRGNALIVGNLMHTGQHGLFFNSEVVSQSIFLETVFKVIDQLTIQIKKDLKKNIRIVGFKDYFETDSIHQHVHLFTKNHLYKVQVQPNMIMDIPDSWNSIDNYILALDKKYKRRYKTALKKASQITKKEMNLDAIDVASTQLYKLYKCVSDKAKVNSFVLHDRHFFNLKKELKDQFKVYGYYLNEELVGFYTLILNNQTLETYFLGYQAELQQHYQLYLNMLYDMLTFGIDNHFKRIVYARTAMEIKSSVGAKPHTMHIYMKHTNNFIANNALKFIVKTLNPIKQWEERHPFK